MILGVGDRVREDAEIVNRMKLLDDDTVVKDRFGKKKTRDIVDYLGENITWTDAVSGVARNWSGGWGGVQIYIFALKYLLILHFCIKSLKIQLHLVRSSAGLGGANAPLHPLWLRYWMLLIMLRRI